MQPPLTKYLIESGDGEVRSYWGTPEQLVRIGGWKIISCYSDVDLYTPSELFKRCETGFDALYLAHLLSSREIDRLNEKRAALSSGPVDGQSHIGNGDSEPSS
jgi:hypothetical protein